MNNSYEDYTGSTQTSISKSTLTKKVLEAYSHLPENSKILIIPPDFTRYYSQAGLITQILYDFLAPNFQVDILPALGTHVQMPEQQIRHMFGHSIPLDKFKVHDWRNKLIQKGVISSHLIKEWSDNKVDYEVNIEVSSILYEDYTEIISIGQVVPHEVIGLANYTKNICVGVGGVDIINKSHFLGAVTGIENILGKQNTSVRKLMDYAANTFLGDLNISYILTVMEPVEDDILMRGLYIGKTEKTFTEACKLSQQVNINLLEEPIKTVVVYLDPEEFHSTWLGNKAIYRTRKAMADNGHLIIIAPGLKEFGEDSEIDRLIRKYGYKGTEFVLNAVKENAELRENLSAAAHLIHGSSENRFKITYCPGNLSEKEIKSVNFDYMSLDKVLAIYQPETLKEGYNTLSSGENVYFIDKPSQGLWALKNQF